MLYQPDSSNFKEIRPGVLMKALTYGENSMLCEFHFKQGALVPAHQHPQEQSGYLVHGSVRFFGDEGEIVFKPGGSWNFKGGVIHGVEILEDSIFIEVFSPVRQDYMPQE